MTVAERTAPRPPAARWDSWWALTVVSALYVASYLNRFIVTLVVPEVKASLRLTDLQMGIVLGPAFAAAYAIFGIPFGWAADRLSRRMVILFGTVLFAVATAVSGMAGSFAALLALRILVGIGEASLSPAAASLVAQTFPKERMTTAVSIFSTGPKLGTAVAFAGGGLIVAAAARASRGGSAFHGVEPWLLFDSCGLVAALKHCDVATVLVTMPIAWSSLML